LRHQAVVVPSGKHRGGVAQARLLRTPDIPHLPRRFESLFVFSWRSCSISSPPEEIVRLDDPSYRRPVLDHLGLVAGMFDALGLGGVIDQVTPPNPERRRVTAGNAVQAMLRKGLGVVNQQLYWVPMVFHNQPTDRLLAPEITANHRNADALGRALETLSAYGVTALYRLIAATAARRLGWTPTVVQLDRPSLHVDGRDNRGAEPDAHGMHSTRGSSRDHRPDLNQVMLDLRVEHQAGIPLLLQPLSGHTRDARDVGQGMSPHLPPRPLTDGTTYLVADSALDSEANLQQRADTGSQWITRVPATFTAAQVAWAQVDPAAMAALTAGDRDHALETTDGGGVPRWVLTYSAHRRPQAQRTTDTDLRRQGTHDLKAFKHLCRPAFACEAEAQQALAACAQSVQATALAEVALRVRPRSRKRGRPRHGAPPDQLVDQIDGALASSRATREALVVPQSCGILATHALDDNQ
jgi:transposase